MKHDIPALLAQLTLEEKAGLCSGADFWHTKGVERLEIPDCMVSDGPHGLRKQMPGSKNPNNSIRAVCFPTACATAASFDTELVQREGEALGNECQTQGVGVLLGPAVNIKRSPLCGRNFEYYSEDPYLAGKMAAGFIRGVQSRGVGTSLKHFAGNNQEFRRLTVDARIDERTLREIYLTAFEIAVKEAAPWTVMCSYNRLNGTHLSENERLLTNILRDEWGFSGLVVSDWGAVNDRVKGIEAGLDLEMPASGGVNDARIVAAVKAGKLKEELVDRAAGHVLELAFRAADEAMEEQRRAAGIDFAADHELATEMEKECAVLLKNKGVLPLRKGQRVAYIGGFAETPRFQGGGSSHIHTETVVSALDAAQAAGRTVEYVKGYPVERDEREETEFVRAVDAAAAADVAVVFAGLPDSFESEAYDRRHMSLPECQNNLIARIAAVQPNTVVVLHCGSPVECPWAEDVAAVLCMYLGGEGVGAAADALLYGEANPSGRLPETWPLRLQDTPCYLDFPGDGVSARYAEHSFVGYRWYDARQMPVRWAFGHGLSYTGYVYHNARLSSETLTDGGSVTVSVEVKNTGAITGKEVVQLYVADETGTPGRPPRELAGFAKVELNPGEEKTVTFPLEARSLSWYSEELHDWYAAPGRYSVQLGHSSRDIHAVLPLRYTTERFLPMVIDENTVVGDLQKDPRTAPLIAQAAANYREFFGEEEDNAAKEAITAEMNQQMLESAPLRNLRSFLGLGDAEMEQLLAKLRAAVKQ